MASNASSACPMAFTIPHWRQRLTAHRTPWLGIPPSPDLPQSPQTNLLVTPLFSQRMVNGKREPGNPGLCTGLITALWPLGK